MSIWVKVSRVFASSMEAREPARRFGTRNWNLSDVSPTPMRTPPPPSLTGTHVWFRLLQAMQAWALAAAALSASRKSPPPGRRTYRAGSNSPPIGPGCGQASRHSRCTGSVAWIPWPVRSENSCHERLKFRLEKAFRERLGVSFR
ncbi:hypothetical protein CDD83_3454 [Cordyceps sp. RAO-2017]|nr:hypothetical protein CDD83_3454 [Cordyceps sp. RAO-2017]